MKTALPNWICALCLSIISALLVEKRFQEVQLSREIEKAAKESDQEFTRIKSHYDKEAQAIERQFEQERRSLKRQLKVPLPQMPKHSSEWSR